MYVFYTDVRFKLGPDEKTTIVVIANDRAEADREVMEMVNDKTQVASVKVTSMIPLAHLPVVLETRQARSHFGKFKFKGLVEGVDGGRSVPEGKCRN